MEGHRRRHLEPRIRGSVLVSPTVWNTEFEIYATDAGLARGTELAKELVSELDALFAN